VIGVVTDSSCDLTPETFTDYHIELVPFTIRFGTDTYLDRTELTRAMFWDLLRLGDAYPQTSAPGTGQFLSTYERLLSQGMDGIVVVTISSDLSAVYQAAVSAARDLPEVRVIDSRTSTGALGFQVLEAARAARAGDDLDAVARRASDSVGKTGIFVALETLDFLHRGGRIGGASALLGTALQIKPIVEITDGVVQPAGRVRTRSKALDYLRARLVELSPRLAEVSILYSDEVADARLVERGLNLSCEVSEVSVGPVIGTHTGPGTVGVAYRLI
jgi:DegV family protein with EDD domain